MSDREIIDKAASAREKAYVPYSRFGVGAAVWTEDGQVFTGCNIENASYGLTNCAERTAVFKAVSTGEKKISGIAVTADTPGPVAPCGACRQVLSEFLDQDARIILANLKGDVNVTTMAALLPGAFEAEDMHNE
ncbi:cytidine deaminase [Salibacterium halotolerans]|uniref:Cytidine deaminase n=1 Tax=Salibacterium halotolerans TaxID=1884432 RepID=A0A1I5NGK3_9BACI|nr:cytidine deaminase [Salibacterium halotolerans]SFP20904.1 cytidine deaminase [Salibacterium halotolerans]